MISFQVLQFARFCQEAGISHFIGSPGSRSAPIVLALVRLGGFTIEMAMDERSAAYKALGLSLALGKPVGLFCTSGTAVLNYGPAIAEAFYQNVPLFVVTADRPPEWIDQNEGQAIRQNGVFQLHTRFSATIPSTDDSPAARIHANRLFNQAFFEATGSPGGPIHLNFPLREPLYPKGDLDFSEAISQTTFTRVRKSKRKLEREELSPLIEIWNKTAKRLVVVGQCLPNHELNNALKALSEYGFVPVLGDSLHNLNFPEGRVLCADQFSKEDWSDPELNPEILLTLGGGLVSKGIRNFIANCKPRVHWHISEGEFPADPNSSITDLILAEPAWFITKMGEASFFSDSSTRSISDGFKKNWMEKEDSTRKKLEDYSKVTKETWSDLKAVDEMTQELPEGAVLFLGNSMAVRYANGFAYRWKPGHRIYANRGTSGIDGCISTSVGLAIGFPDKTVISLVGDMSFIYDRNGLWSDSIPKNLKIVVLNNQGGNIFRILPASGSMPELEDYFELNQPFQAKSTAIESGLDYFQARSVPEFQEHWNAFITSPKAAVFELFTDKEINAAEVLNRRNFRIKDNG
jgi:2-succinyl-5-enolpyruvyl-6-hydroxy-3-cyclohexene-1-carboxylate synthase